MKDKNYIVVQGWMVNKLKLSGNELMIYAVIYGFSQDGESEYEGSGKYLADSCGISRRAVSLLLERLLKGNYILKTGYTKNGVKYCRYKANPVFIPKEGGKEEKEGVEKDSIGGMENFSNNTASTYINNNSTSSPKPQKYVKNPDGKQETPGRGVEKPPDGGKEAEAAPSAPEELKNALLAVDRTLILSADFFPKAVEFMRRKRLDSGYLAWFYKQCGINSTKSFDGYFYVSFFLENMAEKYKAVRRPEAPPPGDVECPACGTVHVKNIEACPECSLPSGSPPQTVSIFRQLLAFPADRRNEYLKRENVIYSEFTGDYFKLKKMIDALKQEFNLEAGCETPSRSFHP
jgi:hypothetical protein